MKNPLLFLLLTFTFSACALKKDAVYTYESETLKIKPISKNTFVHISYLNTTSFGKVACNGMVYLNGKEAIVFDTPVDDKASVELINWIQQEKGKKIKALVVTHFHEDYLGGLQTFHDSGTTSYANNKTIEILKSEEEELIPQSGFEKETTIEIGDESVLLKYCGEGHTKDNIVGYIPTENALFGGCLVKSLNAGKGYLGDANITAWPKTVEQVKAAFPDLKVVVPGHGKHGDTALLDYTIELFENN